MCGCAERVKEERECVWAEVDFVRGKGLTYTKKIREEKQITLLSVFFLLLLD